jgi:6-pyruvoyltetrahydropterin/6-carboxytetrahydropterin synthase
MANQVVLIRRTVFSASHRLISDQLSSEQNQKIFGKCFHPSGHGHNYELEVSLKGPVDPKTGIVMNLTELKTIIDEAVLSKVDHKHLNLDVEEFKKLNPTTENLAIVIWGWLKLALPPQLLYEIKIKETENNIVIYRGE